MKKFIINVSIVIGVLSVLECCAYSQHSKPSSDLVAYHNKILDVEQDDTGLVLQLQDNPICIFAPLTDHQVGDDALEKTYILPRTRFSDAHRHAMSKKLENILNPLGVQVQVQEIPGKNYGLRLIFMMQTDNRYTIVKSIDADKKIVIFNFVKKM